MPLVISDDEIRRRYRAGESGALIASAAGTSRHTIYRLLAAQGVERRRPGAPQLKLDRAEVVRLYKDGRSMADIARLFGCHRPTLVRILAEEGAHIVTPRSRR